ncbi:hypothetical protein EVAR_8530_1 [Eumeta japonica]|uniref:Uncharacterized protein n=1 Tax=Eumeta variegata TaxID=151549 RepID=A0A4C1TXE2_EUMVA|nr:hypothetical protein EVAR_8530_1 [Eumeta japonica]
MSVRQEKYAKVVPCRNLQSVKSVSLPFWEISYLSVNLTLVGAVRPGRAVRGGGHHRSTQCGERHALPKPRFRREEDL